MKKIFLLVLLTAVPAGAGVDRWTVFGPGGDFILGLAMEPGDPDPVLYSFVYDDGLFRSSNRGDDWAWASFGLPELYPRQAPTILAGPNLEEAYTATGNGEVFHSLDRGTTWTQLPGPVGRPEEIGIFTLVSSGATTLYGGGAWLWRSRDQGATWVPVFKEATVTDIVPVPEDPDTVFLGTWDGVWKTADGGDTWTHVLRKDPGSSSLLILSLALGGNPPSLYAGTYGPLYASFDGGDTWQIRTQLGETVDLAVQPAEPNRVYAMGPKGAQVSVDSGAHWQLTLPEAGRSLAVNPYRFHEVWAGSWASGLYVSEDGGYTWAAPAQRGMGLPETTLLKRDPAHPATLVTCQTAVTIHRCRRSPDNGGTWEPWNGQLAPQPLLADLAFDPKRPGVVYGAGQGIYRIGPSGAVWRKLPLGEAQSFELHSVAVTRGALVTEGASGVFRSTDQGQTWKTVLPQQAGPDLVRVFGRMVQDPKEPDLLYALVQDRRREGDAWAVYQSWNGGARWKRVLSSGARALAVHPSRPQVLYAAGENLVRMSRDRGATWQTVGTIPAFEVHDLVVHPRHPSILLAATNGLGVLISRDAGHTWGAFNAGLDRMGMVDVSRILPDPAQPGRFFALPAKGGIFEVTVP
ncbi:MAG TPA: hypothetical protein VH394_27410 [Thermoanaerobaculia bacterium]|jgi:photosystem II stability/assembly factor-like uncharacterized protein|nr:hypothetical protein [Thermoanaerobaculia bacterium]